MRKEKDPLEKGQRFSRLVVLRKDMEKSARIKASCYYVQCDCGTVFSTMKATLKNGTCRSCGCLRNELLSKRRRGVTSPRLFLTHNGVTLPLRKWAEISKINIRTLYTRLHAYGPDAEKVLYGMSFSSGKELKHIKTKRDTIYLTYNGESHTIAEWSEIIGIQKKTLYARHAKYGQRPEKVLRPMSSN